jgi:hypothetical protein
MKLNNAEHYLWFDDINPKLCKIERTDDNPMIKNEQFKLEINKPPDPMLMT